MWRVKECECHFPDVIEDQLAGIRRPALGQDEQVVDQLDRVDHRVDGNKQRCRHQQRQHDAARIGPAAGALDVCRFLEIHRNCLQCREIENHEKPSFFPDCHDDDRP